MYTAHAYDILEVMSYEIGTSINFGNNVQCEPAGKLYTPGTYVRFITPTYIDDSFTISVA